MNQLRCTLLLASLTVALGCSCDDASSASGGTTNVDTALRDDARIVMEEHCGSCHISTEPTARPGAVAVFDLMTVDWAHRLDKLQRQRIVDDLAADLSPGGHDGVQLDVPPGQQMVVQRYLRTLTDTDSR